MHRECETIIAVHLQRQDKGGRLLTKWGLDLLVLMREVVRNGWTEKLDIGVLKHIPDPLSKKSQKRFVLEGPF
jgi:hypothetical protein